MLPQPSPLNSHLHLLHLLHQKKKTKKQKNPRPPHSHPTVNPRPLEDPLLPAAPPSPLILSSPNGESSSSTSLPWRCPSSSWITPRTSSSQRSFANATTITRKDYTCASLRPEREHMVGNRFVLHRAHQPCRGRKLRLQLGSTCELQGDSDGALFAYERALHHNYQSIQALNAISCILRTKENFPRAVEYLQTILKLDQSNGEVWGSLGSYILVGALARSS